MFDYGCGDGGDWPSILRDHSWLRLVGYEPYGPSYLKASERLRGLQAKIFTGNDLDALDLKADFVVSFSVFEHVVNCSAFLRNAKHLLSANGVFFLNYDDGHFRNVLEVSQPSTWLPALRAWGRTIVSRPLAWLGFSSFYQKRVTAQEADRLVATNGFQIERVDYHNLLCLKELSKIMPPHLQKPYAAWWLEAEKHLNDHMRAPCSEERYGDCCNLWRVMLSRTLKLKHSL